MPIIVVCPSCNTKMHAPDWAGGIRVRCPKCGKPIRVPDAEDLAVAVLCEPDQHTPAPPPDDGDDVFGIAFTCRFCGDSYQVAEDLAGKKVVCRSCREPSRVPDIVAEATASAASRLTQPFLVGGASTVLVLLAALLMFTAAVGAWLVTRFTAQEPEVAQQEVRQPSPVKKPVLPPAVIDPLEVDLQNRRAAQKNGLRRLEEERSRLVEEQRLLAAERRRLEAERLQREEEQRRREAEEQKRQEAKRQAEEEERSLLEAAAKAAQLARSKKAQEWITAYFEETALSKKS